MAGKLQQYRCNVESLKVIANDKEVLEIQPARINSVVIQHNYETSIMPVMYMSLSLNSKQYNTMFKYRNSGKLYVRIRKTNLDASTVLGDKIHGQFKYYMSATDYEHIADLSKDDKDSDKSLIRVTIGVMDNKLIQYNKHPFNNVYRDVYMEDMIRLITEDRNTIIAPITHNKHFSQLLIPAVGTRIELLKYLFTKYPFYDSKFSYFTDYDCTYLYNQSGDGISVKGKYKNVYINILPVTSKETINDGITVDKTNKCYTMVVREDDKTIHKNLATEEQVNHIVTVHNSGISNQYLDKKHFKVSDDRMMVVRATPKNGPVIKNDILSSKAPITITKLNVDADIFTPDKKYIINIKHRDRKQKATLIYKKEVILKKDKYYTTSTSFAFRCVDM